jgi:hypothetical protein
MRWQKASLSAVPWIASPQSKILTANIEGHWKAVMSEQQINLRDEVGKSSQKESKGRN